MNFSIDKNSVEILQGSKGQLKATLNDVEEIYKLLNNGRCRVILIDKMCFLVFDEIINVEFAVEDYRNQKDLSFVSKKHIQVVDSSKNDGNYFKFLLNEAFQGKGFISRFRRFLVLLLPLVGLNAVGYFYGDTSAIGEVFTGFLTAVSIFIAIFSLFVTSHDYMTRKKVNLFESGQLSYYFSVDKYVTKTGIIAIILSVFGLVLTSANPEGRLYTLEIQNILIVADLNLIFLAVYIILRSMVEFYIVRPGRFIMSDMKVQSFNDYRNSKNG